MQALFINSFGVHNTASGLEALRDNTTGSFNTANGMWALDNNTTGFYNTAIGFGALQDNTTGSFNTAIGENAGFNLRNGDNNIYLGSDGVTTESNTMRLGDDAIQTRTFIAGIINRRLSSSMVVAINSEGQLGIQASSARYK